MYLLIPQRQCGTVCHKACVAVSRVAGCLTTAHSARTGDRFRSMEVVESAAWPSGALRLLVYGEFTFQCRSLLLLGLKCAETSAKII
jgi:hypothetical protein